MILDGENCWEFYDNKLELDDASAKKYGGKIYRDLEEDFSDAFDYSQTPLPAVSLRRTAVSAASRRWLRVHGPGGENDVT